MNILLNELKFFSQFEDITIINFKVNIIQVIFGKYKKKLDDSNFYYYDENGNIKKYSLSNNVIICKEHQQFSGKSFIDVFNELKYSIRFAQSNNEYVFNGDNIQVRIDIPFEKYEFKYTKEQLLQLKEYADNVRNIEGTCNYELTDSLLFQLTRRAINNCDINSIFDRFNASACGCMGPRDGEEYCNCKMNMLMYEYRFDIALHLSK